MRSVVTRFAIASVGRFRSSLTIVTITGVRAAAIGVPWIQNREVIRAAANEAALAMISVLTCNRLSSSRVEAMRRTLARRLARSGLGTYLKTG